MKSRFVLCVICLIVLWPFSVYAQGLGAISRKVDQLEEKLNQLEAQQKKQAEKSESKLPQAQADKGNRGLDSLVNVLASRVESLQRSVEQIMTEKNDTTEKQLVNDMARELREIKESLRVAIAKSDSLSKKDDKKYLEVKFPVSLYGYVKLDVSYDRSWVSSGNYCRWVESTRQNDDQFNVTARQTRLGLNFAGPNDNNTKTSGKVEIDFYNDGAENKNLPMLRHAFLKVTWPKMDFSVLAGQTSDVFSPLAINTINYIAGWWVGNIGYRRPQLRLSQGVKLSKKTSMTFELAAARSIGAEAIGNPCLQGRVALSFPVVAGKKGTIGVSGHSAREENFANSWSENIDLSIPLCSKVVLEGEGWHGENLDNYLGGIGQGVKGTARHPLPIKASGGWGALNIGPLKAWQFYLGASIDDPEDSVLANSDKTQNSSVFGNCWYNVNSAVQTGFEISYWNTRYKGLGPKENLRAQWAWIYKF